MIRRGRECVRLEFDNSSVYFCFSCSGSRSFQSHGNGSSVSWFVLYRASFELRQLQTDSLQSHFVRKSHYQATIIFFSPLFCFFFALLKRASSVRIAVRLGPDWNHLPERTRLLRDHAFYWWPHCRRRVRGDDGEGGRNDGRGRDDGG